MRLRSALLPLAVLVSACPERKAPSPAPAAPASATPPARTAEARAEADEVFTNRCALCHGPEGKGDGPVSKSLSPPPRNFQEPAWQSSVTDAHIEQIIEEGGQAVGKSVTMPPNPDLAGQPVIQALRAKVRALKKP